MTALRQAAVRSFERGSSFWRRARKDAQAFGLIKGPLLLAYSITGGKQFSLSIPEVRHPIHIRPRSSDFFVLEQIFVDKDYELEIENSPSLIIDAGANVGFASIYFANRYPRATILAIEPERTNFECLVENTRPYSGVVPILAALWGHRETLSVDKGEKSWSCTVHPQTPTASEVITGITVDELIGSYDIGHIDIFKMDIEGAEIEVLNSNSAEWLDRTDILIVELHDRFRSGCSEALSAAIRDFDFDRSERGENTILIKHRSLKAHRSYDFARQGQPP
jgi:FkbM family methyltransferase